MGDTEDVYRLEDLRAVFQSGTPSGNEGTDARGAVLGVALAVIAVCLAFALVLHVYGAVAAEPVDTNDVQTPGGAASEADAQQRFQNYITAISFMFAPFIFPPIAVAVAFAGVRRARGTRLERIGSVAIGAAIGILIGYVLYVLVGQLAYGEAPDGFYVESLPVGLRFGVIATNALAMAVTTGIGSLLAGYGGLLLEGDVTEGRQARAAQAVVADAAADAPGSADDAGRTSGDGPDGTPNESSGDEGSDGDSEGSDGGDDERNGEGDDERNGEGDAERNGEGDDERNGEGDAERNGEGDTEGETDTADRDQSPVGVDESTAASDYQDPGTGRRSTPHYDPEDRDWNGTSTDDDE